MFVRKIQNPSGSISVQVISKKDGKYRMVKSFGSTNDPERLAQLLLAAQEYADNPSSQRSLFFALAKEDLTVQNFLENLSNLQVRAIGPELIFGALFDRIGFNVVVPDQLFRHIVIARLVYPASKLKTADYLYRYRGITVSDETIYRFLDKLNEKYKEKAEKTAFEYTKRTLKNIAIVFYDMTTLYFESENEDDLRKIGFSKDGKFQNPQIMLGLLVGENGYPIGYDIFKGNTFEGHTLIPIIKKIQKKYGFEKPIVVADAALLSKKNIEGLIKEKYEFIIGARIKNETEKIKQEIIAKTGGLENGQNIILNKSDKTRLIISYSDKRRKKDKHNREKGIKKLQEKIKSGKLTKSSINNRGYNKFLKLNGSVAAALDNDKIKNDELWDGLKGYATNTRLEADKIIKNYSHLWQIEKAFRISKTDLRIRPIYHYLQRRIEAHICIAFVAYTIYKELERLLNEHKAGFSPKRAAELTHNMYEIEYILPHSKHKAKTLLRMDAEQQILYGIIYK
ncbi:IS1634 family transposase [Patescibacteria group bacterium]|nr:IS1634 family transposase [Patescibacteria group bacterium]